MANNTNIEFANTSRIAKNSLFMYIRMFITMVISLFTVRVVVKILGIEDYGLYSAIGGVVLSLSFLSTTLSGASQRFFSVEIGKGNLDKVRVLFSSVLLLYLFVIIILLIIAETLGLWFVFNKMTIPAERIGAIMWVYQFAIASFVVSLITSPYQALILANEHMNIYAYLSILEAVLKLGVVFVLDIFPSDKLILYSGLVFGSVLLSDIIYIAYAHKKFDESHIIFHANKDSVKSITSYCGWSLFGSIAFICNEHGLNILLNIFWGPVANAAFSIANQVKNTVVTFGNNFFLAVRPALTKNYACQNEAYTRKLYYFSTKVLFTILFVLAVPLYFSCSSIINVWLTSVNQYMITFTRLLVVYSVIFCMSAPITTVVQAVGAVKRYHVVVDGFMLITILVAYGILKAGAAAEYAFVVSISVSVIAHFLRLYILQSVSDFTIKEYLKDILLRIIICVFIAVILLFIFNRLFDQNRLVSIMGFFISIVIAIVTSFSVLYSGAERKVLLEMAKKRIYRKKSNCN